MIIYKQNNINKYFIQLKHETKFQNTIIIQESAKSTNYKCEET